ncbi:GNAT family N-acetyltransferase [Spongiimicrobium salis]|uniref:GNAT family N-acetyltransferase n=1 Tax=Spongiimicrobium salis TaxID=1667022 RepID=UPI00374D3ED5
MQDLVIREIKQEDNAAVAKVIRSVLLEMGVPKIGTTYADTALDRMYETYDVPGASFFVLEILGAIAGCAGVIQLERYDGKVCELQKMYFLKEARGRGLGAKMIEICLERAISLGYEKCYLETMPYMENAQNLYLKNGFRPIDGPMGDTGHHACSVWMLKDL